MDKRIFWKSARTKTVDSHNPIDSIGSIDCIHYLLVPHKRPPTFPPHTRGKTTVPMGAAPKAPPPSVLLFARAQRAPLCVWCECWRSFVWHEYRIYRIYKIYRIYRVCRVFRLYRFYRIYTVYRAYRIYRIVRIYSFGTRRYKKNTFLPFLEVLF